MILHGCWFLPRYIGISVLCLVGWEKSMKMGRSAKRIKQIRMLKDLGRLATVLLCLAGMFSRSFWLHPARCCRSDRRAEVWRLPLVCLDHWRHGEPMGHWCPVPPCPQHNHRRPCLLEAPETQRVVLWFKVFRVWGQDSSFLRKSMKKYEQKHNVVVRKTTPCFISFYFHVLFSCFILLTCWIMIFPCFCHRNGALQDTTEVRVDGTAGHCVCKRKGTQPFCLTAGSSHGVVVQHKSEKWLLLIDGWSLFVESPQNRNKAAKATRKSHSMCQCSCCNCDNTRGKKTASLYVSIQHENLM